MAPLYNPAVEKAEDARACIDQFEFPDIPCVYPVVWVRAREAALLCRAMGKRLCDAHEWEGACAGALLPPDYRFDLARGVPPNGAIERMREVHNRLYGAHQVWAYGSHYEKGICASSSFKTSGCSGGSWTGCGSNTFPVGSYPACRSSLGVYDLHGNAAEHMNLPLNGKPDGQPGQSGAWLHGDERQLVHLRYDLCSSGLVPMESALLAWQPGDGCEEPPQLSSGVPVLQNNQGRLEKGRILE